MPMMESIAFTVAMQNWKLKTLALVLSLNKQTNSAESGEKHLILCTMRAEAELHRTNALIEESRVQEPVAYGVYAENGNIRVWWLNKNDDEIVSIEQAKTWSESNCVTFGEVTPLYAQPIVHA